MKVRVVDEVVRRIVRRAYGPCLICGRETGYSVGASRLGAQSLERRLTEPRRSRLVEYVKIGVDPPDAKLPALVGMLCDVCGPLVELRWQYCVAERQERLRLREERRAAGLAANGL